MTTTPATAAPEPPRHRSWPTVLLCAVIFLAGGVVGGGTMLVVVGKRLQAAIEEPELVPRRVTERMQRRLGLTDGQAERVQSILQRRQRRLTEMREHAMSRVSPELDDLENEIAQELDRDQARRFRHEFGELRRRWTPWKRRR